MSANSSSPWIVPSSPNVPWSTGKITSTSMPFCVATAALSKGTSPCPWGTGGTITASPLASTTAPGVASGSPARRWRPFSCGVFSPRSNCSAWLSVSQRPSLVMPIGTTSYFCLSIALSTDAAESNETSCSPLRPPKRIPTLSFFITNTVKEHSAVSNQLSLQSWSGARHPDGHYYLLVKLFSNFGRLSCCQASYCFLKTQSLP